MLEIIFVITSAKLHIIYKKTNKNTINAIKQKCNRLHYRGVYLRTCMSHIFKLIIIPLHQHFKQCIINTQQ